jgi:O-antigen ligase
MLARTRKEIDMYIGGGILGTILVIALIVFLLRRA